MAIEPTDDSADQKNKYKCGNRCTKSRKENNTIHRHKYNLFMQMLKHLGFHLFDTILTVAETNQTKEKFVQRFDGVFRSTQVRKIIHKLLIFMHILRVVKTSCRKNLTGLRISKIHTTSTKGVLCAFKSLLIISIGRKIRLLGAFRLRLGFDILDVSVLQTLHAIAESLDSETIGVGLSGLSKIILFARPKFSNTSVTLIGVLDGLNLGPFRFNLLNLRSEFLRKGVRFSGRTYKSEEAIRILNTRSFSDSLQTSSVR